MLRFFSSHIRPIYIKAERGIFKSGPSPPRLHVIKKQRGDVVLRAVRFHICCSVILKRIVEKKRGDEKLQKQQENREKIVNTVNDLRI